MLAIGGAAVATSEGRADLVAGWNFNGVKPIGTIGADFGTGVLDLAGVGGEADLFAGSELNAFGTWDAGDALGLRGTAAPGGLHAIVVFGEMLGTEPAEVTLSFAARRSATGFASVRVESWDGSGWSLVDTLGISTDWSVSSSRFTMSHATELEFRLTPIDASAGAGTLRLDNLLVDVAPVPTPGVAALGAVAAYLGRHRRRRAPELPDTMAS